MEWFLNNWLTVIGLVGTPLAWFFGGKQAKKAEVKNTSADFLTKVEGIYSALVDDLKADRDALKEVNLRQDEQINKVNTKLDSLQNQFNDLNLAYVKEVEKSQYWMQKYDDLDKKYNDVISKHNQLEKDHEALKKEFEAYKQKHK